jgi:CubicO group peptidase (beta-lactamase class C family)
LNGRRLLKSDTVALMSRNNVGALFAEWIPPITGGMGFGLGVMVVEDEARAHGRAAGAFGWGGAYGTESWADPKLDVSAALFIQMEPAPGNVKDEFRQAIRKAIVA